MVNNSATVETFRDARKLGTHWLKLVRALDRLEASGLTDEQGRSWARVAAELSGYTVNQIRQMQRTLALLEQIYSQHNEPTLASILQAFPFSHLEILSRIAKLDPSAASSYMQSAIARNARPTYRELRDRFYALRDKAPQEASPIAAGLKSSRQFQNLCLELLTANSGLQLYGHQAKLVRRIVRWPGAFRYANPDLLIELRPGGGKLQIDAADCISVYGDIAQEETVRRIRRIDFEASFFSTYWILLPTWSPGWLFASECKTLELRNVGVAEVDVQSRTISIIRKPMGPPKHDRTKVLHDMVSISLRTK